MTDQPTHAAQTRAPVFNIPLIIVLLSLALIAVHVARISVSRSTDLWVLREFAYVPGRLLAYFDPRGMAEYLRPKDAAGLHRYDLAQVFVADGRVRVWTAVTYAFLHANVAHLGLNLVWFVAFGSPVARRFGIARFLAFLLVAAIASAAAQTIAQPYGVEPVIGASGAVSGVVAAALRFVFQPGASLLNAAPQDEQGAAPGHVPALPLIDLWRDRQVVGFLTIWFVLNVLFGLFSQPLGISDQPIAWQAHIGGFAAGLLSFSLFDPRRPRGAEAYRDGSG